MILKSSENNAMDIIVFKKGNKTYMGFVIEPFDIKMIVYFNGKSVTIDTLTSVMVIKNYRHWIYTADTDIFEQQRNLYKLAVTDSKDIMKKLLKALNSKSELSTVFVYMILANKISFPADFAETKVTSKMLTDEKYGFTELRI